MKSPSEPAVDPAVDRYADAPTWLAGMWRRQSIRFPDGTEDRTTQVHWGQTRRLYVDLRIPQGRPAAGGRRSLSDFTLPELCQLAEQKGFAGHILMENGACSWVRYIDYRPDTGRLDAGRLRLDGDTLYEEGDLDSVLASAYQEIYRRERSGSSLSVALRLIAHEPSAVAGFDWTGAVLVLIDDCFLFARPRRMALPRAETLRELVEAAANDRALVHAYLDCELSLGRHGGPWQVEESTLPFREGGSAWDGSETRLMENGASLLQENGLGRFRWRIVESSEPVDRLPSLIDR